MITLLYIQLNILLVIFLAAMYVNVSNDHFQFYDQTLFKTLIITTIVIVVFDTGMWFIDKKIFPLSRIINFFISFTYLALNPVECLLWFLYAEYKLNHDKKRIIKRMWIYLIPCIINAVFLTISLKTNWIFYIDIFNTYHRGKFSLITPILSFTYFFLIGYLMIKKSKSDLRGVDKEIFNYFVLFLIPPLIAAILQISVYGVSTIWAGFFISELLIFINLQNNRIYMDRLTNVYNRDFIEERIKNAIELDDRDITLFCILADIDEFKQINDTFGHLTGDRALVCFAEILKTACGYEYRASRYGGDEFIITGVYKSSSDVEILLRKINDGIDNLNRIGDEEFTLKCSMGISVLQENDDVTSFVDRADKQMYSNKNLKRK